jgi:integrase
VLDCLQGRHRVRNPALVATNVIWGLRAHEALDVRIGDILNADGSFRDGFTMEGARLKGGKPRAPWKPKPKPRGHGKVCACNLYNQKEPKRSAPEIRHLPILPEMKSYLSAWLKELRERVGELTPDLYLWLSRKRHTDGTWRALSRQSFWFIITQACKLAESRLPNFRWTDYGSHSCRKTVACGFDDIEEAQHFIGHKSSATTSRYRLANPKLQRQSAMKLAARYLPAVAA